ncbi:hypothetical protein SAMN04488057_101419 [Cyclobacterium lianum]|uniref:Transglutaminase-like superfamily protein n=1 Tax=Cyclobacterium lianum TaxID=388280 RepID=A0A1M7IPI1_9BACT|nr:hypothetical protein [Cyclobacterium lianum]SHM42724.1 hypothetical protein SAMN04488057_101419 [Cyclobacterium lianum]
MHIRVFTIICFLLAVMAGKASALTSYGTPSEAKPRTGKVFLDSWRAESERFADLQVLLEKDFLRFGKSEKMVKNIFYRAHQKLFRQYQQFTLDRDVLEKGLYDCVSGSLILATLLDHFGFVYEVKETSYHVFLEVWLNDKSLLLEVTDPRAGFIADAAQKSLYLSDFSRLADNLWEGEEFGPSFASPDIYQTIDLQNLLGLQYFNQAIRYFNEGNPLAAYQFSITALKYHDTERIRDFSLFLKQELVLAAN